MSLISHVLFHVNGKLFRNYFIARYLNDFDVFILSLVCKRYFDAIYVRPIDRRHIIRRKRKSYMMGCASKYGNKTTFEWFINKFARITHFTHFVRDGGNLCKFIFCVASNGNMEVLEYIYLNLLHEHNLRIYRKGFWVVDKNITHALYRGLLRADNLEGFLYFGSHELFNVSKFDISIIREGAINIARYYNDIQAYYGLYANYNDIPEYYRLIGKTSVIYSAIVGTKNKKCLDMFKYIYGIIKDDMTSIYTALKCGNINVLEYLDAKSILPREKRDVSYYINFMQIESVESLKYLYFANLLEIKRKWIWLYDKPIYKKFMKWVQNYEKNKENKLLSEY